MRGQQAFFPLSRLLSPIPPLFFEAQKDSELNFSQFFCFEKEVFSGCSFILQIDGLLKNCNLG